jgi:cyclophilin family peptidyl-prolyl cis-trans isomerase
VIQAGDGGENDQPTVPLEAGAYPHVEGAVGLARDVDPDSGSTELYVCLADRPHLDGKYAVFGRVADGLDVLRRIGAVEVEERWVGDEGQIAFHEPVEPVIIRRARLRPAGAAPPEVTP